ncbi:hypothetical protein HHI36_008461 [Cryptolaemus montrouzieri]|uniref:GIY-YIG domain-containing protein n=1 Tax=Cryptolaemus montrouzieri TaxID=559131 RepID=A0ABD2MSN4_9CUCU
MGEGSNVVYGIPCLHCIKKYIGQTSQLMKNRITGHKSDTKNYPQRCALATHSNAEDQKMVYDDITILARSNNTEKNTFLEMFDIFKEKNLINKKQSPEILVTSTRM